MIIKDTIPIVVNHKDNNYALDFEIEIEVDSEDENIKSRKSYKKFIDDYIKKALVFIFSDDAFLEIDNMVSIANNEKYSSNYLTDFVVAPKLSKMINEELVPAMNLYCQNELKEFMESLGEGIIHFVLGFTKFEIKNLSVMNFRALTQEEQIHEENEEVEEKSVETEEKEETEPTSTEDNNTKTFPFEKTTYGHDNHKYKLSGSIQGEVLTPLNFVQQSDLSRHIESAVSSVVWRFGKEAFEHHECIQELLDEINLLHDEEFEITAINIDNFVQIDNDLEVVIASHQTIDVVYEQAESTNNIQQDNETQDTEEVEEELDDTKLDTPTEQPVITEELESAELDTSVQLSSETTEASEENETDGPRLSECKFGGATRMNTGDLTFYGCIYGELNNQNADHMSEKEALDNIQDRFINPLVTDYVTKYGADFFANQTLLHELAQKVYNSSNGAFNIHYITGFRIAERNKPDTNFKLPSIIMIEPATKEEKENLNTQPVPPLQTVENNNSSEEKSEKVKKPKSNQSENTTTIEFYTDGVYQMNTHKKYRVSGRIEGEMLSKLSSGQLNNLKLYVNSSLEDAIYRFGEEIFNNTKYTQYFINNINKYFGHQFKINKILVDNFVQLHQGKEIPVTTNHEVITEDELGDE